MSKLATASLAVPTASLAIPTASLAIINEAITKMFCYGRAVSGIDYVICTFTTLLFSAVDHRNLREVASATFFSRRDSFTTHFIML